MLLADAVEIHSSTLRCYLQPAVALRSHGDRGPGVRVVNFWVHVFALLVCFKGCSAISRERTVKAVDDFARDLPPLPPAFVTA